MTTGLFLATLAMAAVYYGYRPYGYYGYGYRPYYGHRWYGYYGYGHRGHWARHAHRRWH